MHHVVPRRSNALRHEVGRFTVQNRGRIGRIPRERVASSASAVALTVPVEPVRGPGSDTGHHAFGSLERPWPVRLAARAGWAVWDRLHPGLRARLAACTRPISKVVAGAAAPLGRAVGRAVGVLLAACRRASCASLRSAGRSARFLAALIARAAMLHATGLRVVARAGSVTFRAVLRGAGAGASGLLCVGVRGHRKLMRAMCLVLQAVLAAVRLSALAAGQAVRLARRAGAGMRAFLLWAVGGIARGIASGCCAAGRVAARSAALLWRGALHVLRAVLRAVRAAALLPWKALLFLSAGVAVAALRAGRGASRAAVLLLRGARLFFRGILGAVRFLVLLPWRILRLAAKALAAAARAGFQAARAILRALLRCVALACRLLVRVTLLPFQGVALLARALLVLLRLSGRGAAAVGRLLLAPVRGAAALLRTAGQAARSAGDAVGPLLVPPAPRPAPAPQAASAPSFAPAGVRSPAFALLPAGEARRAAAEEWLVSHLTGFGGGSAPELTLLPRGALVAEAPLVEPRRGRRRPRLRGIASTLAFACATTLPTIALVAVVLHSRGPAETLPAPELAQMAPAVQPPAPVEAQPAQAPAMPAPLQAGSAIGGKAMVLAADIFAVDGRNLRLAATAAPPIDEVCEGPQGQWPCGQAAALEVSRRISGQDIVCRVVELNDGRGLPSATCRLNDRDIGGWLIRNGLALAYGPGAARYRTEEEQAQQERRGLWQGRFVVPWDWGTQGAAGRVVGSLPPPPAPAPPAEPGPALPGQNRQVASEAQRAQGPRQEAPRPRCPEKPTVRYLNIEPVKPAGC